MGKVELLVDGVLYGGWTEARIHRSIENISGAFELSVTERWKGQDTPRPIRPGATCEVRLDGKTVITGHVDDVQIEYDGESHSVNVSGRDATGDLVDSSAEPPRGYQIRGKRIEQLAQEICTVHGVKVKAEVATGKPLSGNFTIEMGESVFECIERAARLRGVLCIPDGAGGLLITQPSTERIPRILKLGDNIRRGTLSFSHRDRFNRYVVRSQMPETDENFGSDALQIKASHTDTEIRTNRVLAVRAESVANREDCAIRARWESSVRHGRGTRLQYTVSGWEYAPGKLWPINRLVRAVDSFGGIDHDMLIAVVDHRLGSHGATTDLTLAPRESYSRVAEISKDDKSPW